MLKSRCKSVFCGRKLYNTRFFVNNTTSIFTHKVCVVKYFSVLMLFFKIYKPFINQEWRTFRFLK